MVVGVTVPEQVYKVLSEIVSTVKDVLPTPELREVLQQTYNYLEQVLFFTKILSIFARNIF